MTPGYPPNEAYLTLLPWTLVFSGYSILLNSLYTIDYSLSTTTTYCYYPTSIVFEYSDPLLLLAFSYSIIWVYLLLSYVWFNSCSVYLDFSF